MCAGMDVGEPAAQFGFQRGIIIGQHAGRLGVRGAATLAAGGRNRVVHTDMGKNETVVEVTDASGRGRYDDIGLIAEARSTERYRIVEHDPLSCEAEVTWTWLFERDGWNIRTEMRTKVVCDKRDFIVSARLEAFENEQRVFERDFAERIRRNGN